MPIINYSLYSSEYRDCLQAMPCKEKGNKRSAVKNLFHSIVIARSAATQQSEQNPAPPHPRHSERSEESISTLNLCERLAALFSFSRTFLRKKVPKNLCTVKMAASVFGRSLSGHGRLTLFRTPAPGARSLDGRNPAISTSAGFRKNHSRAWPGRSRNVSS